MLIVRSLLKILLNIKIDLQQKLGVSKVTFLGNDTPVDGTYLACGLNVTRSFLLLYCYE